jgi:MEMO1 family protein
VALPEKPQLRPIEAFPSVEGGRRLVILRDPTGYSDQIAGITEAGLLILALFDGTRTIRDVQAEVMRRTGELVPADQIQRLVEQIEQALLLEGDTFEAHRRKVDSDFLASSIRPAHHAGGAYEADANALAAQLDRILDGSGTPGAATDVAKSHGALVGLIAPHIDYARGVAGYREAYAALRVAMNGGSAPDLFVVFGTRHAPAPGLFNLTRKDYETPIGATKTAQDLVHRIAERGKANGHDLFAGEAAHRTEHSIEFQCVFLKHLMGSREFEVLPVLCGALEEPMSLKSDPAEHPAAAGFIDAVRDEVRRAGRRTVYIAGADLAHVGPHFGDADPVTEASLIKLGGRDRATMEHVVAGDAKEFFADVAADGDQRKICGIPPIWATLAALGGSVTGEMLHYGQAREPEFASVVTYAAAALYATSP